MKLHQLYTAIGVALLSGCASHSTLEYTADPETKVTASLPLCLRDCKIEVINTNTQPPDKENPP